MFCKLTHAQFAEVLGHEGRKGEERSKSLAQGKVLKLTSQEVENLHRRLHVSREWLASGNGQPLDVYARERENAARFSAAEPTKAFAPPKSDVDLVLACVVELERELKARGIELSSEERADWAKVLYEMSAAAGKLLSAEHIVSGILKRKG